MRSILLHAGYRGALPPPNLYHQFSPDTRERILRMAEAFTSDESRRQDRLVDAEIEQAKKSPTRTFAFFGLCVVLAMACVVLGDTLAAGLFVGVPVLMFLTSQLSPVHSRSSRSADGKELEKD